MPFQRFSLQRLILSLLSSVTVLFSLHCLFGHFLAYMASCAALCILSFCSRLEHAKQVPLFQPPLICDCRLEADIREQHSDTPHRRTGRAEQVFDSELYHIVALHLSLCKQAQ